MGDIKRKVVDPHQKNIVDIFSSLTGSRGGWELWSDFIVMTAIEISNCVDTQNAKARSETYKQIRRKYKENELEKIAAMLAEVVNGLDENPEQDFLGDLYMKLNLGNEHIGQFFTPYSLCALTARINAQDLPDRIDADGFVSVNDCAVGAGALLVAFANECKRQNVNYQQHVLFTAQDINLTTGLMCYIQLSMLGCAGYIVIADTLSSPAVTYDQRGLIPQDNGNVWRTPMFFSDVWLTRRMIASCGVRWK